MTPRVLISDELSPAAVRTFEDRGLEVDYEPELGKDKSEFLGRIGRYDGLAVRSATKVTEKVVAAADRLQVIGRAGVGVDNIDVAAATARGIVVMNTPFGNSITTAEHAVTMMMSLARQIPAADASTQAGKWEKSRFMGVELFGKTLGVVGCGNIGAVVADRAQGLKMRVVAHDPFLSAERAVELGVEKVEFEELLRRADFISLHTPLTDKTRGVIGADALARMKPGVRIVNCARGGLIDEAALKRALDDGRVAGAALDVFQEEPARENPLFGLENVVCTPHLGASTTEAQENVALQVAEQISDYLLTGAVANALNMPSIGAEEAPKLKPFVTLAERLGSFAGQLVQSGLRSIVVEYAGEVSERNTGALTSALLAGLMRPAMADVNMVSAPAIVRERGIDVDEVRQTPRGVYDSYIRLTVKTERRELSVAGTVFSDGKPRIIQIEGVNLEAELGSHMLCIANEDKPGFIGALGTLLGDAQINIATFHLGRQSQGENAIALVEVDGAVPSKTLNQIKSLPQVNRVDALTF